MANKSVWNEISLKLSGGLDTRSVPAELPPAWFRWKQNFEVTPTGQLKRRGGHERFYADSDGNHDHHHQGDARQRITFLQETTDASGVRRLFDGTENRLSYLNESTGAWTDILSISGSASSRWKMGVLQNVAVVTNGSGAVHQHTLGSGSASTIADLATVVDVKLVVEFSGFVFIMNFTDNAIPHPTRIRWSDLNLPASWAGGGGSLAGSQDLDYGDEILAALPLYGALYVFTRRAIWRLNVVPTGTPVITFTRVYYEPENQKGCIVYPNTLVTDGQYLYYASRDAIYRYSPFVAAPERGDERNSSWGDWLYRASGVVFTKADTRLTGTDCAAPCAEYKPSTNELWFSWPALGNDTNNWTLVANTTAYTCDVVDHGYISFTNYRRTPTEGDCSEAQDLLGVSGSDWSLKSLGKVFFREFVTLLDSSDLTVDVPLDAEYYVAGYRSQMKGMIPSGLSDREKHIRRTSLELEAAEQDAPCVLALRIGNSHNLSDPNSDDPKCSVLWNDPKSIPLACSNAATIAAMKSKNQRPDSPFKWKTYQTGKYLYFDLVIENRDGTPAIGGDSSISQMAFDLTAKPK